jgi:arylsulfatase A-like enzyme
MSAAALGKARRAAARRAKRLSWQVRRLGAGPQTARSGPAAAAELPPLVFVVVIDGLRPDSIDAEHTPNLYRLRREGVSFERAHSVFPTATRVNATAIASGAYPASTGIMHNTVYLPEVDPGAAMTTGRAADLLRAQDVLGDRLVQAETLGEMLAAQGMKLAAVSSASTGSALLLNPCAPQGVGVLVSGEFDPGVRVAYPEEVNRAILERFGPAPRKAGRTRERSALVRWTQRVLLEYVVPELAPDVVIDWFTEPDHTQHAFGVGSPQALAALRTVDREIGTILETLDRLDLRSRTNLFVLSDHGVTCNAGTVDIARVLIESGLKDGPGSDDVVVAGGGPSAQIHVRDHDPERIRRIVRLLQDQPWIGVVFTSPRSPASPVAVGGPAPTEGAGWVDGTFSLDLAHASNAQRGCDILFTLTWSDEPNEFGVPGTEVTTTTAGAHAMHSGHGGLSPWAMRTTFFGVGPDLRTASVAALPAAQVDLVPTILHLKGIGVPAAVQGRVLREALRSAPDDTTPPVDGGSRTLTTQTSGGRYAASVRISTVGAHRYLDEGGRIR